MAATFSVFNSIIANYSMILTVRNQLPNPSVFRPTVPYATRRVTDKNDIIFRYFSRDYMLPSRIGCL